MPVPSYYDILQVPRNAPAQDIRHAYRRMAQRYHPDKSPDNQYAPRVMAHLNKAYEILSDPARREKHDRWIERKETRQPRPGSLGRPAPLPGLQSGRVVRWPWYLLFATISCAVLSIGTVAYKSVLPGRPPAASPFTPMSFVGSDAAQPAQPPSASGRSRQPPGPQRR